MSNKPSPSNSRRVRAVAIVSVFGLVFAAGVFWLARTVMTATASDDVGGSGAGDSSSISDNGSQQSTADTDLSTASPQSTTNRPNGSGVGPPVPDRRINVAGVTLDNSQPDETCTTFSNERFEVPVRVTKVIFSPSKPGVVLESSHCPHDEVPQSCRAGVTLRPNGGSCYIGIGARTGQPAGNYDAKVSLALTVKCPSRDLKPCNGLRDGFNPTPDRPVDGYWTDKGKVLYKSVDAPQSTEPTQTTEESDPTVSGSPAIR